MRGAWYLILIGFGAVTRSSSVVSTGETTFSGEGCYTCCFEANDFIPRRENNSERWWVAGAPRSFDEQFRALAGDSVENGRLYRVSVKIRATLSSPGHYGHMGGSDRLVKILDFTEMRPLTEAMYC